MTITNTEIIKICKNNGIKLNDVIMKDQLKHVQLKNNLFLIINLQSSTQGNGTHWTALAVIDNQVCAFDSFGAVPSTEIVKWKGTKSLAYSKYIIQDLNSTQCGLYCIAWLHYIQTNRLNIANRYNDFVNMFDPDTKSNDRILMSYLKDNKII